MGSRRSRKPILLALLVATAAAFVAYVAVANSNDGDDGDGDQAALAASTAPPVTAVLIAKRDIPAATTLTGDMVEVRQVSPEAVSPRALTAPEQAVGMLTAVALTAGEQILDTRLTEQPVQPATFAREVPVGMRAMSLVFDEVRGIGGLVQPGDRVDVIAYFEFEVDDLTIEEKPTEAEREADEDDADEDDADEEDTDEENTDEADYDYKEYVTVYVIQDVEVLAVAQALSPEEVGIDERDTLLPPAEGEAVATEEIDEPKSRPDAMSVTLAVTPEQAQRLLLAAQTVTDKEKERDAALRLTIRAPGDRTIYDLPPAQLGEIPIGGLLGDVNIPLTPTELVITDVEFTSRVVDSGEILEFKATVKNVSDRTIISGADAPPEFVYTQGIGYDDLGFFAQPDTYRIALNVSGASPVAFPYRWGLGRDLAPGESTTIVGSVQLTEPTPGTRYWLGVILGPNTVTQDGVGVTDVTVLAAEVVTVGTAAPLLAAPGSDAEVIQTIAAGQPLTVLGVQGPWFRVSQGGQEGWIAAQAVTASSSEADFVQPTADIIGEDNGPLPGWLNPGE